MSTMLENILEETQGEQGGVQLSKEEFAAKKQTERDAVYALGDQAALDVASDSGKFQQYLDVQARFDRYSATNALLVMAQRPTATRLGDFDHWKEQGCPVKREETGIFIIEPGKQYTRRDGSIGQGYEVKRVFDIAQVDVSKAKTTPARSEPSEREKLLALIKRSPFGIDIVDTVPGNIGAQFHPESKTISVQKGMSFGENFQSLAQTIAYGALTTAPNPPTDPHFSAACVAYMLCKRHGVEADNFKFSHAPHVFAGMEASEVKAELTKTRDVATDLQGRMARTLEPQQNKGVRTDAAR